MKFGLDEQEYEVLFKTLIQPLIDQGARVWVFGSRARGDYRPFSDVDILYELSSDQPLPKGFLFELKDSMDNSNFPYKVDLVERKEVAKSYRDQVEQDKVRVESAHRSK